MDAAFAATYGITSRTDLKNALKQLGEWRGEGEDVNDLWSPSGVQPRRRAQDRTIDRRNAGRKNVADRIGARESVAKTALAALDEVLNGVNEVTLWFGKYGDTYYFYLKDANGKYIEYNRGRPTALDVLSGWFGLDMKPYGP